MEKDNNTVTGLWQRIFTKWAAQNSYTQLSTYPNIKRKGVQFQKKGNGEEAEQPALKNNNI